MYFEGAMKIGGKRLSEMNPVFYALAEKKENIRKSLKDQFSTTKFAESLVEEGLPVVISSHESGLIKRGKGIDVTLQENKAVNIRLACACLNGLLIRPGEVFSFWRLVGNPSPARGYKNGRVIIGNQLRPGPGGGLCNLANLIHWMVIHSPLEVVEFHNHSDALAPDEHGRVPFSAGTSVSYSFVDYRFRNNTDQDIQLLTWCDGDKLYGELRCTEGFPWFYRMVEEGHHFHKEGDKYYRISKIYKETTDRRTGEVIRKDLILDNHSEVMFDYSLIPPEQIR